MPDMVDSVTNLPAGMMASPTSMSSAAIREIDATLGSKRIDSSTAAGINPASRHTAIHCSWCCSRRATCITIATRVVSVPPMMSWTIWKMISIGDISAAASHPPRDAHGIDAADAEMARDCRGPVQPKWRDTGRQHGEALFQLGPCQHLADTTMRAATKNRMQPRRANTADIEHVGIVIGALVAHARHDGQRDKRASRDDRTT